MPRGTQQPGRDGQPASTPAAPSRPRGLTAPSRPRGLTAPRLLWLGVVALLAGSVWAVAPDPARLAAGLPRLLGWLAGAWPPDFSGPGDLARRVAETLGIASLGTALAALLALPCALFAARPVAPVPLLLQPVRSLLDALRGIDGFVFALLFVAAVGLGPFAGMLGVALHSAGTLGKLWSETLEAADPRPAEAIRAAGGTRLEEAAYALLPETLPQTVSSLLYVWEANIRGSTVLGLVGAGGIGQELKNAVDLLDFNRLLAVLILVVGLVLTADRLSAALRRRLL